MELSFKGEIVGEGLVEYLMFYDYFDQGDPHKSTATYVGLIRFKGQLKGKAGTFVMEDRGSFRQGTATSVLRMIPESGTGELKGIGGAGMYSASQEGCRCDLTYELK